MYNIYATINQAARQGARVAAQSSCATCGNARGTNGAVDTAIASVLQADNLDPTHVTGPTPAPLPNDCPGLTATCTTTARNVTVCRNALLTPITVTPAVCGVLVEFTYKMDLPQITIPFGTGVQGTLPQPQIAARAQMGVEQ
jgi:hypothetical protein